MFGLFASGFRRLRRSAPAVRSAATRPGRAGGTARVRVRAIGSAGLACVVAGCGLVGASLAGSVLGSDALGFVAFLPLAVAVAQLWLFAPAWLASAFVVAAGVLSALYWLGLEALPVLDALLRIADAAPPSVWYHPW